ncbi:MAG: c-type cytochrome [Anaerolineae bacterium]
MNMRRHLRIWVSLSLAALVMVGCAGLAGEPVIVATLPPSPTTVALPISLPQSAPDIALGAQVFADNCTRCHGQTGKGDGELVQSGQVTNVPDFTNPQTTQDAAPIAWYEIVTNGKLDKLMPPWADKLSEAQRWSVTMYVYTLADTPAQVAQGQAVWAATCAECHGETGEGTENGAPLPNLLEKTKAELLAALDNGIPDNKHAVVAELAPEDRAAALAYAETLALANVSSPHEVASAPTAVPENNPQPASTEEAGAVTMGTVTGKVLNMTAGGSIPTDLTLNLHMIDPQNTSSPGEILHTPLNADGTYQFENVAIHDGWQYVVTTSYNGTAFNSAVVDGTATQSQIELPLNIYETSDDASEIQINAILTMVQTQSANRLEVVQIYSFTNESDHLYLKQDNGSQSSVSVRLPQGATFEDFSGSGYLVSADGTQITDTQPVFPGAAHVMHVAYSLPYADSAEIDQLVDYRLNGQVEVMVGTDGLSVTGDGFAGLGARQLGGRSYMSYGSTFDRNAGETVRFQVQGTAASTTSSAVTATSTSPFAYLLIGAGLLAIGAAFGFFMRERVSERTAAGVVGTASSGTQVNALMKQIADLDVQHQAGKLSESKYKRQRAELKAQLTALMKQGADTDSE